MTAGYFKVALILMRDIVLDSVTEGKLCFNHFDGVTEVLPVTEHNRYYFNMFSSRTNYCIIARLHQ